MREQSRLHVQITLKELDADALMFILDFFFHFKTNHSEVKTGKGSRCVTESKYSQKQSKTEYY